MRGRPKKEARTQRKTGASRTTEFYGCLYVYYFNQDIGLNMEKLKSTSGLALPAPSRDEAFQEVLFPVDLVLAEGKEVREMVHARDMRIGELVP